MVATLVGNFIRPRPNKYIVITFAKNKWDLKGQLQVTAMAKGFMSFEFSFPKDYSNILCIGNWSVGRSSLILQK